MKLLEIQGRIETLGRAAVHANSRKYDYISFVGENGAATHVKKLHVSNLVDAAISPGAQSRKCRTQDSRLKPPPTARSVAARSLAK